VRLTIELDIGDLPPDEEPIDWTELADEIVTDFGSHPSIGRASIFVDGECIKTTTNSWPAGLPSNPHDLLTPEQHAALNAHVAELAKKVHRD
jgi:hypothetical protein